MRDLRKLIEEMEAHIPKNVSEYQELLRRLDKYKLDCIYAAPENPIYFHKVAEVLNIYLVPIDTEWKQNVADIFNGKI